MSALSAINLPYAVFGERNKAHALLLYEGASATLFEELAGRTDRPSSASGLDWSPYLSGFQFRDFYVVARTFPDPTATRSGMVLTHAVLVPLSLMGAVNNLTTVVKLLPDVFQKPELVHCPVISHQVLIADTKGGVAADPVPPFFAALVRKATSKPVVWLGQDGFEEAIIWLWAGLWPAARLTFSFRLSFGPDDISGLVPTAVSTPLGAAGRWHSFPLVSQESMTPETNQRSEMRQKRQDIAFAQAEQLLLRQEATEKLRSFVERFTTCGLPIEKIADAALSFHYLSLLQPNEDEVKATVRLLSQLAPNLEDAVDDKELAIGHLLDAVRNGTAKSVHSLRNLNLAPFAQHVIVEQEVELWAEKKALDTQPKADLSAIFASVYTAPQSDLPQVWWSRALSSGLQKRLAKLSQSDARTLWAVWTLNLQTIRPCAEAMRPSADLVLAKTCPRELSSELRSEIVDVASHNVWTQTLGTAASVGDPVSGAQDLIALRPKPSTDALNVFVARLDAEQALEVRLRIRDRDLGAALLPLLVRYSEVLARLDITVEEERNVLTAVLAKGAKFPGGKKNAVQAASKLLELASQGQAFDDDLWTALAQAGAGDVGITQYGERVWELIPSTAQASFLDATASGWIGRWIADQRGPDDLPPRLLNAILRNPDVRKLFFATGPEARRRTLQLFEIAPSILLESDLVTWLRHGVAETTQLDADEVASIAAVVASNEWQQAATLLKDLAGAKHPELRTAVVLCRHLLSFSDRAYVVLLGWDGESNEEERGWNSLVELIPHLYSSGLSDREVWRRAGGEVHRLDLSGDGNSQWIRALRNLRHGGGGKITPPALVETMLRDYPNNATLRKVAGLSRFRPGKKRR